MTQTKTVKADRARVSVRLILPDVDMAVLVDVRSALKLVADRYPGAIVEILVGDVIKARP